MRACNHGRLGGMVAGGWPTGDAAEGWSTGVHHLPSFWPSVAASMDVVFFLKASSIGLLNHVRVVGMLMVEVELTGCGFFSSGSGSLLVCVWFLA